MTIPAMPIATYRLQLTPTFGFTAAAGIVEYLADLGVSHLYLSPIFEARAGSIHGYDQTDPRRLRLELGGERAFECLVETARRRSLGIIIDIVPNHMAAHHANPWWYDMLKNGPGSPFARFFDVDWYRSDGRIVLPVLGTTVAEATATFQLRVETLASGEVVLCYFDNVFPLREDIAPSICMSAAALEDLLARQHYELTFWKDGLTRVNYRRFFDISDLASLRVEDDEVFDRTHELTVDLVSRGWIDGVRVDHIDGLRDPLQYLQRLRSVLDTASKGEVPPLIYVEKILACDERLPADWPIDGTTGYEFLSLSTLAMVDPAGLRRLRGRAIASGAGVKDFHALAITCKEEVAESLLGPELSRLCDAVATTMHMTGVSIEPASLRPAIMAVSARLGVYRTYGNREGMTADDTLRVRAAVGAAVRDESDAHVRRAITSLADVLLLNGTYAFDEARSSALDVIIRWQQFTGPLAAKGVEDTALYRDMACPALNDVGTEPVEPSHGRSPSMLFTEMALGRAARPFSMNTSDTHDAKRSEDIRSRLAALSHASNAWHMVLESGMKMLGRDTGLAAPSAGDISLIMHSAAALWPVNTRPGAIGVEAAASADLSTRLKTYIQKAVREAKLHSSWTSPSEEYEQACERAVDSLLFDPRCEPVRVQIEQLAKETRPIADRLSIATLMLKTLFPGTPDWYQGTECHALALVDPDNRRPVDFDARKLMLERIRAAWVADPTAAAGVFVAHPEQDESKLFFTWRSLAIRRYLHSLGHPLTLESLATSPSRWHWVVSAGRARCEATVSVHSAMAGSSAEANERVLGFNQLSASSAGGSSVSSWASLSIPGLESLI